MIRRVLVTRESSRPYTDLHPLIFTAMMTAFGTFRVPQFAGGQTVSVAMPSFPDIDHSDPDHWIMEAYASNHTDVEAYAPLQVFITFSPNEKADA